jgi:hypothetical protein
MILHFPDVRKTNYNFGETTNNMGKTSNNIFSTRSLPEFTVELFISPPMYHSGMKSKVDGPFLLKHNSIAK